MELIPIRRKEWHLPAVTLLALIQTEFTGLATLRTVKI